LTEGSSSKKGKTKSTNKGAKKAQQVMNKAISSQFKEFEVHITNSKFNDLIKKVGAPPTVKRDDKETQMCMSYHL
jgi:hypothetical protein